MRLLAISLSFLVVACATPIINDNDQGQGGAGPGTGGTTSGSGGGLVGATGGAASGGAVATGGAASGGAASGGAPSGGAASGGGSSTGGTTGSSCTGCNPWSSFGYSNAPALNACVTYEGTDYTTTTSGYNEDCPPGPPGRLEWCGATHGIYAPCP